MTGEELEFVEFPDDLQDILDRGQIGIYTDYSSKCTYDPTDLVVSTAGFCAHGMPEIWAAIGNRLGEKSDPGAAPLLLRDFLSAISREFGTVKENLGQRNFNITSPFGRIFHFEQSPDEAILKHQFFEELMKVKGIDGFRVVIAHPLGK